MADEPEPEPTEVIPPESATPPAPTSEPTPAPDPVVQEREARIRAEARAQTLEEELARARAAKPLEAEAPPKPYTAADVQAAFDKGDITDAQRIQYLARLEAQAETARQDARQREVGQQQTVGGKIDAYLSRYPDLKVAGSALVTEVWDVVQTLATEEGLDPQDKRTHLRALVERFGPLKGAHMALPAQRKIPVGTSYGTPPRREPREGSPSADPLKDVPEHIKAAWVRLGADLSKPETRQFYANRWNAMQDRRAGRMSRVAG